MEDEHEAIRLRDELPQSSGGRTITTTEPKFIPKEAAKLILEDHTTLSCKMVDCVGFMVDGATGHMEDGEERMVKTPWFQEEIPFTMAAEVGTSKVIEDHATVGVMVITDGSFSEIERQQYVEAERKTLEALKKASKPYVVILNTMRPFSEETKELAKSLSEFYHVNVLPLNCEQLKRDDILHIIELLLWEFPLTKVEFFMPKWIEMLSLNHPIKQSVMLAIKQFMTGKSSIKAMRDGGSEIDSPYISYSKLEDIDLATGTVKMQITMDEAYYYDMLSQMTGKQIRNEYELMELLKDLAAMQMEYSKVLVAMEQVRNTGYGVVTPMQHEIEIDKPEIIKHSNKYGVKIHAKSPSIHMIRAGIETEIAPIVGTKDQAEDLISYIQAADMRNENMWDTNIFGKTLDQLVQEGIQSKISSIGEESQLKLQESMQKIVNDSNGGMVCIII